VGSDGNPRGRQTPGAPPEAVPGTVATRRDDTTAIPLMAGRSGAMFGGHNRNATGFGFIGRPVWW